MVVMTSNIWVHPKTKVYYFRREVPKDIREAIGKREWKVSLKTKNINEARLKHNAEAQKCEEAFAKERAHLSGNLKIFPSDAPILADRWASSIMEDWKQDPSLIKLYTATVGGKLESAYDLYVSEGLTDSLDTTILEAIKSALVNEGLPLPSIDDPARTALSFAFREQYRNLCQIALCRAQGNWSVFAPIEHAETPLSISASQDRKETTKLSYVFDKWAEDKRLNDGTENRSVDKTIGEYGTAIRRFIELYDDLPVDEITRAHVQEFKESLAKIPSRTRGFRGKTVHELIQMAECDALPTLSLSTIQKQLKCLSTILNFGRERLGLIEIEPVSASGITRRLSKAVHKQNAKTPKQKDYSFEEIRRIFSSALYTSNWQPKRHNHRNALYWIPLLMAYSGARREEVCQLNVSDIHKDKKTEIWCMVIAPDNIDKITKHDKSRTVPLHDDLLSLGFLDYVNTLDPKGKLFPTLKLHPTEGYGASFGKLWSKYLKDEVKLETQADPAHGFRHSFKTLCRSVGIQAEVHDWITGHSPANEGGRYGQITLETAKIALDSFPSLLNMNFKKLV